MLKVLDILNSDHRTFAIMFRKELSAESRKEILTKYNEMSGADYREFNASIREQVILYELDLPMPVLNFECVEMSRFHGLRLSKNIVVPNVAYKILKNFNPDINIDARDLNSFATIDIDNWIAIDDDYLCQFKPLFEDLKDITLELKGDIVEYAFSKKTSILTPSYVRHKTVTLSETCHINKKTGECTRLQFCIRNGYYVKRSLAYDFSLRNWTVLEEEEIYLVLAVKS